MEVGYKIIPDDQKMTMHIAPEPGKLLRATTVGGAIRNMGRLLRACADNPETDEFFVVGLEMDDKGEIAITFAALPLIADTPAPSPANGE